ncbi:MAG: hypothetical protein JWQ21_3047 [Herminiimonas sp.]|nr:hypothetical protein [Herminiimonas sp.]
MPKLDFPYDDEFRKDVASIAKSMSGRQDDWLLRFEAMLPKFPEQMRESKVPPYTLAVIGTFTFSKDDSDSHKVKIVCPRLKRGFGMPHLDKFKLSGKVSSDKLRLEKKEVSMKLAGALFWPRGGLIRDIKAKLDLTFNAGEFGESSNALLQTVESMYDDTYVPWFSLISVMGDFEKRCSAQGPGTITLITDELGPEIR